MRCKLPTRGFIATWAAIAVAAACLALAGGASARGGQVVGRCLPPTLDYRAEFQSIYSYDDEQTALKGKFHIHKSDVTLKPPVDWNQNPEHSFNFAGRLQDLAWMDPLLYAFSVGKGPPPGHTPLSDAERLEALGDARDFVVDWVKASNRGDVPKAAAWTDRTVGRRVSYIAYVRKAADCQGILSDSDRKLLDTAIDKHGKYLSASRNYKPTNHGLSMDLGLALIDYYLPSGQHSTWAQLAKQRYHSTFNQSYQQDEGVWLEHSPGYFDYALSLVRNYLDLIDANDPELSKAETDMMSSLAWFTEPDGFLVQFGDTVLDEPNQSVGEIARRQSGMHVFPKSGYAVVKQLADDPVNGSWFGVASSFFSQHHKHSDELSFDLYGDGHRLVSDTGKYAGYKAGFYGFQRSAKAHSTLTVDGKDGVLFHKRTPYRSGILASNQAQGPTASGGWYAVEAENPLAPVSSERFYLYKPGEALIVIDSVRASHGHTYRRYFQLGPDVTAKRDAGGFDLTATAPGFSGHLWSESSAPEKLGMARGQRKPILGWTFPDFRKAVPRWTVWFDTKGKDVDHIATFDLGDGLRAHLPILGGQINDTQFTIPLSGGGATALVVARAGDQLTVNEVP
jgi:hypothetical protein